MTTYSIIYLDNYHCLKCGQRSDNLKRMEVPYKVNGISVKGSALLCPRCTTQAKLDRPASVRAIIGDTAVGEMIANDNSPYCEVMDADYYELIEYPAERSAKLGYARPVGQP